MYFNSLLSFISVTFAVIELLFPWRWENVTLIKDCTSEYISISVYTYIIIYVIRYININKINRKKEFIPMDIVHLTIRIDKQLRTDFQIIAKKQDTTATEILTKYIQKYIDENK